MTRLDKSKHVSAIVELLVPIGFDIQLPKRNRDGKADYTTYSLMLYLGLIYVHVFFEFTRKGWYETEKRSLSAQVYYGLGPDSGPTSSTKRHKYVSIWKEKK